MRWILILFLLFFSTSLFAQSNKNVLILNSYHKGFELTDTIINNIEKVFYPYEDININILYMDSKQIHSRAYVDSLRDLYSIQLKNRKYDLIITIDRFAYHFAVKSYKGLFHGEPPILFTGVEEVSQELTKVYGVEAKINGIIRDLSIEDNIKLIQKVMPRLKKLYILNDRSENGNESSPFIRKAILNVKDKIEIEYLRDDTLEEFKEYFSTFKKDEAILFVRYTNDRSGEFYKTNEISFAINSFKLPVFVTDTLFMDKGAIGGKVISIEKMGLKTGRKALKILYDRIALPDVETNEAFEYIFDAKKLKDFNIILPANLQNIKLINAPIGFFDKYRTLINSVFLISPFLIVIIFGLVQALYSKQQTARQLQERIEFDKALLNAINSPIFWQDKNGVILDTNVKFCQLVELPCGALQGHTLNKFFHNYPQVRRIINYLEQFNAGNLEDSQITIRNRKGEKRIYFIHQASYQSSPSMSGVVTIFTDITKEKEAAVEKAKQTQYMIQQTKLAEIGEVFSSIAHQWKSPLVAITALAQDLFYSQERSEKEEESYHINNIMTQVQYMTNTINDFQDFIIPSKEKTNFDVHNMIKSMLNIVRHNMKYNYVDVQINVTPETNLMVYGYENEFMQAILNIVHNAKDALLQNSEKNRHITINLYNKHDSLLIDIIDNGPGISKEAVDKIFVQYFSTKEQGHGIGLYMTKLIIEDKMGGKIKFKHLHDGSCFRIKLKSVQGK
mgnify:CR=1 FL=1